MQKWAFCLLGARHDHEWACHGSILRRGLRSPYQMGQPPPIHFFGRVLLRCRFGSHIYCIGICHHWQAQQYA